MPGKKHVAGVGSKEQRMYEHIKQSATASVRKKWPHLLYSSTIARKGIRQASEQRGLPNLALAALVSHLA